MKTTIDQNCGVHPNGLTITKLFDVVTDESLYPDHATALDAHRAQVELQSLPVEQRQEVLDLLCEDSCDPENEAQVIRARIAEVVGKRYFVQGHSCKYESHWSEQYAGQQGDGFETEEEAEAGIDSLIEQYPETTHDDWRIIKR